MSRTRTHLIFALGQSDKIIIKDCEVRLIKHDVSMNLEESHSVCRWCEKCNKLYPNIQEACFCLKSHGLVRCFGCFKIIENNSISLIDHYRQDHYDPEFPALVKCYFCKIPQSQHLNSLKHHVLQEHLHLICKKRPMRKVNEINKPVMAHQSSSPLSNVNYYDYSMSGLNGIPQNMTINPVDLSKCKSFKEGDPVSTNVNNAFISDNTITTQKPTKSNSQITQKVTCQQTKHNLTHEEHIKKNIKIKNNAKHIMTRRLKIKTKQFDKRNAVKRVPQEREPRRASLMAIVRLREWTEEIPKHDPLKVLLSKKFLKEKRKKQNGKKLVGGGLELTGSKRI